MRHTAKVLSYILISSMVTSLVFASDKKAEEELFKNKQSEQGKAETLPPGLDPEQQGVSEENNLILRGPVPK